MNDKSGREGNQETVPEGGAAFGPHNGQPGAGQDFCAEAAPEGVRPDPAGADDHQGGSTVTREQAEELEAENAGLRDSLMRLKAEFDNYRKRTMKEQSRMLETAEAGLMTKLLPVIDNMERALESFPEGEESSSLRRGVEMVMGQLLEVLGREGLEAVSPRGELFDPEHHEAIMVVRTDECPEGTVMNVIQKGYRFNESLLRPAMVSVSCANGES